MLEIRGLGGAAFELALEQFRAGEPVLYRGVELVLRRAEFECRVPAAEGSPTPTPARALEALTRARFRIGALLASARPLEASVGNRPHRLVLVRRDGRRKIELYELRGDRLRRMTGNPPPPSEL
jgi:hypothetical protein